VCMYMCVCMCAHLCVSVSVYVLEFTPYFSPPSSFFAQAITDASAKNEEDMATHKKVLEAQEIVHNSHVKQQLSALKGHLDATMLAEKERGLRLLSDLRAEQVREVFELKEQHDLNVQAALDFQKERMNAEVKGKTHTHKHIHAHTRVHSCVYKDTFSICMCTHTNTHIYTHQYIHHATLQHLTINNTHTPTHSPTLPSLYTPLSSLTDSLQRSVAALSDAQHATASCISEQKDLLSNTHRAELTQCEAALRAQHMHDLEKLKAELVQQHQVSTLQCDKMSCDV
jgi:hypothetical protein